MHDLEEWKNQFESFWLSSCVDDKSHDISHFQRVWSVAKKIAGPKADLLVILAGAYFHDLINYPKNDPRRSLSSKHSAEKTKEILTDLGFPHEKLENVAHCIESHSFSANIPCETLEAKILQDADRMEAIGAIGLARVFYTAGRMGSSLFDPNDPLAKNRKYDDKKYALDHFSTKLLKLKDTMQTDAGKIEAQKRQMILNRFVEDLLLEIEVK